MMGSLPGVIIMPKNWLAVSIMAAFVLPLLLANPVAKPKATDEEAVRYLELLEKEYSRECNKQIESRWKYITNITKENEEESVKALNEYLQFQRQVQQNISETYGNWRDFTDDSVCRQFKYLAIRGPGDMDPERVNQMNQLVTEMETSYSSAKICEYGEDPSTCEKTLSLDPDLVERLKSVKDYDELEYYWTAWHDTLSKAVPTSKYKAFVDLQNEYAKANNYSNMGELWAQPYDDGTSDFSLAKFRQQMLDIWAQLKPNYDKLHAYVRMKLRNDTRYESHIRKYGYLPAHLLGNMWAQEWTALANDTKPYPDAPSFDATDAMIQAGYTPAIMFDKANEFFKDLGLLEMTQTFKDKSMFVKPTDGREVVCHASAEDFCLGKGSTDFRIKMCTKVNQEDFVTIHHEMGHIEYFMQYTDLPYTFRDGANPGFHEAIGDALALAVSTPKHMQCKLGLEIGYNCSAQESSTISPTDINYLYIQALEKFAFFPFALSMDSWRWGVFDGTIPESDYNSKWWEIRREIQGVVPPATRVNSQGLDSAAKYHIVANVEYIRYFISHILQFQFYQEMCVKAGEFDPKDPNGKPLHVCDFSGSQEAGKVFADMMKLGFSQRWPEAMKAITGSPTMSIEPLLNYFKPVFDMIDQELKMNGESVGYGTKAEEMAREYVQGHYETEMSKHCNLASVAEFNYETDLNNPDVEAEAQRIKLEAAEFEANEYNEEISQYDFQSFADPDLKRQFKFLNKVGTSLLESEDLQEYNQVLSDMSKIYGTAKICPYKNQTCDLESQGLSLDPHLTEILRNLGSYNEMAYVWEAWREASGEKMRDLYYRYIDLSNKAAQKNGFNDMGEYWLDSYESETFKQDIDAIWKEVRTRLYEPLYDYVRHKLAQRYPQMDPQAPMPAHVFGNMWAQTWENVLPYALPYPDAASFDITKALQTEAGRPGWGGELAKRMMIFDYANNFFKSLDLADMKMAYGDKALILKPKDREVICHASAWDMCDKEDFRIKMCTEIDHDSFITAHHELGHIQYYLQYKNQPISYRKGANPGFHEAIGDLIALSVSTPGHLKLIGLLKEDITQESLLNYQMQMGLEKIAFLPFAYMMDRYRWGVFSEEIPKSNLTYNWLKLRAELQGVTPPFRRNEKDFDAGAKYHIASDTPYIRYFVSYILQFQLHKKLCQAAGQVPSKPLHECDIYGNPAASKLLKDLLQSGASKPWPEHLLNITGSSKLDASAIIEYFQPLVLYLQEQSESLNYPKGWNPDIEFFYGEGDFATPTEPTTTTTTTTIAPESTPPSEPSTESNEIIPTSAPPLVEDKHKDHTIVIAIGVALGVGVAAILGYIVFKRLKK